MALNSGLENITLKITEKKEKRDPGFYPNNSTTNRSP